MSEKRFNYQNYLTNLQDKLQTKIKLNNVKIQILFLFIISIPPYIY